MNIVNAPDGVGRTFGIAPFGTTVFLDHGWGEQGWKDRIMQKEWGVRLSFDGKLLLSSAFF